MHGLQHVLYDYYYYTGASNPPGNIMYRRYSYSYSHTVLHMYGAYMR